MHKITVIVVVMTLLPMGHLCHGGEVESLLTPKTERAIDRGLKYLMSNQNDDGSWGSRYRVGVTSLTLMACMARGEIPTHGKYGDQLELAVDYLLQISRGGSGYLATPKTGLMYEHGLATLALTELWGMTGEKKIRRALKKAVKVILRAQNPKGGWRYKPQPRDADLSVTVMQVVALASAKEAGIFVPDETIDEAIKYTRSCWNKKNGGFGYKGPGDAHFATTAAAVTALCMSGRHDSEPTQAGIQYLQENDKDVSRHFYYSQYYGALALNQASQDIFKEWYPIARKALLKKQQENGSWGGTSHKTPMALLALSLPYRYLPIHQR